MAWPGVLPHWPRAVSREPHCPSFPSRVGGSERRGPGLWATLSYALSVSAGLGWFICYNLHPSHEATVQRP
jgi:hypothetical protein